MIMLSSVAAFCAMPGIETLDISQANEAARNFSVMTKVLSTNENSVIISPIDPDRKSESLIITITNPRFAEQKESSPLSVSVQYEADAIKQELLRAKVTCSHTEKQDQRKCAISVYQPSDQFTVEQNIERSQPCHTDLYECIPQDQDNIGKTLVNVNECTNAQCASPYQMGLIVTTLPQDVLFECACRFSVAVDLDASFPRCIFSYQRFDKSLRTFIPAHSQTLPGSPSQDFRLSLTQC